MFPSTLTETSLVETTVDPEPKLPETYPVHPSVSLLLVPLRILRLPSTPRQDVDGWHPKTPTYPSFRTTLCRKDPDQFCPKDSPAQGTTTGTDPHDLRLPSVRTTHPYPDQQPLGLKPGSSRRRH